METNPEGRARRHLARTPPKEAKEGKREQQRQGRLELVQDQGPKKGRTTFKDLKRRIAELESKEAANGNRNENRDEDGDGNDGNAGNGDGNRSNPALQRK